MKEKTSKMSAEEILSKHLSEMVNRTNESYVSVEEMKDTPEWQTTINAMEEYASLNRSEWISVEDGLPCQRCKKLEFMIKNGLGYEDMENDI